MCNIVGHLCGASGASQYSVNLRYDRLCHDDRPYCQTVGHTCIMREQALTVVHPATSVSRPESENPACSYRHMQAGGLGPCFVI